MSIFTLPSTLRSTLSNSLIDSTASLISSLVLTAVLARSTNSSLDLSVLTFTLISDTVLKSLDISCICLVSSINAPVKSLVLVLIKSVASPYLDSEEIRSFKAVLASLSDSVSTLYSISTSPNFSKFSVVSSILSFRSSSVSEKSLEESILFLVLLSKSP